jgi:hypothetical protein
MPRAAGILAKISSAAKNSRPSFLWACPVIFFVPTCNQPYFLNIYIQEQVIGSQLIDVVQIQKTLTICIKDY